MVAQGTCERVISKLDVLGMSDYLRCRWETLMGNVDGKPFLASECMLG